MVREREKDMRYTAPVKKRKMGKEVSDERGGERAGKVRSSAI